MKPVSSVCAHSLFICLVLNICILFAACYPLCSCLILSLDISSSVHANGKYVCNDMRVLYG